MKKRNSLEYNLQDNIWGVYPISIQCQKDYQTSFRLYFQKSLQIISQHQTANSLIHKGETMYFNIPTSIESFRVQSDKIMDYKWSLYIKKKDFMGNNEEFIQSQYINLRDEWNQYKQTRRNSYEKHVIFQKVKIKFSFLIIIAINNKDLQNGINKYFSSPKSGFSNILENYRKSQSNLIHEQQSKSAGKAKYYNKQNHGRFTMQQIDVEKSNKSISLPPVSKQNSKLLQKPQFLSPSVNVNKKDESNQFKLSNSDLEIGNQIQQHVQMLQSKNDRPIEILSQLQKEEEETKVEKQIRMTSSQLLDSKGIPILPFYKKKSVIVVMLAFLILVLGQIFFGQSSKKTRKKDDKNKKKRKSKQKY